MKKTFLLMFAGAAALTFTSCKKEKDSETPLPVSQLSVNKQGSYDEVFVYDKDTIEIAFEATGKDYDVLYLGEKRVSYAQYDSTMMLCDVFSYRAFYFTDINDNISFQVKKGEKVTKKVVFAPSAFSYKINQIDMVCAGGSCFPTVKCVAQSSNGVGNFKSILQFKVDGVVRSIEVTAVSKQNVCNVCK